MPITKCRECGKEVSTAAATCPHCGVVDPAGSGRRGPDPKRTVDERPVVVKRGGRFARFLLWIILVVFLVVLAAWYFGVLRFN